MNSHFDQRPEEGGDERWCAHAGRLVRLHADVLVGISTGSIAGFVYRTMGENICLSAVFMGTLYWFFYGTAFVIGLLEIMAGELETGVTRFIAVSVKTFVLCLGAGFGMMMTLKGNTHEVWRDQNSNCNQIDLDAEWWRIPLYLLCSASVLGQYRFPIRYYWRALIVQLAAYEAQYQLLKFFQQLHTTDNLDYAASNTAGAVAGVLTAVLLSLLVGHLCHAPFQRHILQTRSTPTRRRHRYHYFCTKKLVRCVNCLGIGRKSDLEKLELEKKIR
jgi:hypothetical protein